MSKFKWYNPSTWTNKEEIRFTKLFGSTYGSLLGNTSTYNDDYETYLLEGYEKNDVVRAIVDRVSNSASTAKFYLKNKKTGKLVYNKHFELVKENAGNGNTFSKVIKDAVSQKMLTGNGYIVGEKGNGVNKDVYSTYFVVESSEMYIESNGKMITGYRPNISTSYTGVIPPMNVVHLKTINPTFNSQDTQEVLYGVPPLRSAKESIKTYNDSKLAGLYFLQNKGAQKALLLDEEATLTPEGEDQLKQQIRQRGQGVKNNANIPILEGVKAAIDLSADPKKALIVEQRLQAAQEICNVFNYPSQLIGLTNATYQNAKEAKKAYWEACVIPELDDIVEAFNRGFIKQYGKDIVLCYDLNHVDALQEDKLLRGQAITSFAGLVTINQALEMAGLPTYDWMKTPTNMEEYKEQLYHGFTQMAITDDANGQSETNSSEGEASGEADESE